MTSGSLSGWTFDGMRAVVVPGSGVVMRFPGMLCVAPEADPAVLEELARICAEVTATAPDLPARPLARRLAAWLAASPEAPDVATVAAAGVRLGVFLHGAVTAELGGDRYSGADAAAWTDRLVTHQGGPIALLTDAAPAGSEAGSEAGVLDLRAGVVPGAGVLLLPERSGGSRPVARRPAQPARPAGVVAGEPVAAEPVAGEPVAGAGVDAEASAVAAVTPPDEVAGAAALPDEVPGAAIPGAGEPPPLRAPKRAAAISGIAPEEPARAPLDDGSPAAPATPQAPGLQEPERQAPGQREPGQREPGRRAPADERPQARGYLCSRDHLNDPRNQFCIICGIRMDERTGVVVLGARPPLGLLVFDDGATFTVDADYLLGRAPESDPRVRAGELRPLSVQDPDSQVSRGHLVIKINGWDVTAVDESRNGTLAAGPAEQSWSRLPSRQPLRLVPGTRIRVGGRSFIFESPSGVR